MDNALAPADALPCPCWSKECTAPFVAKAGQRKSPDLPDFGTSTFFIKATLCCSGIHVLAVSLQITSTGQMRNYHWAKRFLQVLMQKFSVTSQSSMVISMTQAVGVSSIPCSMICRLPGQLTMAQISHTADPEQHSFRQAARSQCEDFSFNALGAASCSCCSSPRRTTQKSTQRFLNRSTWPVHRGL